MSLSRKSIFAFASPGLYKARNRSDSYDWTIYKNPDGDVFEWYTNAANLSYSATVKGLGDEGLSYSLVDPNLYSVSGTPKEPNIHFRTLKNAEWLSNTAPDGLYKRGGKGRCTQFACKKDGVVYFDVFAGDPSPAYCAKGGYTLKKIPMYEGEGYGEFVEVPYDGYKANVGSLQLSFVAPLTIDYIFDSAPDGVYQREMVMGAYSIIAKKDGVVYTELTGATSLAGLRDLQLRAKPRSYFTMTNPITTVNMTGYGVVANGETARIVPTVRPRDMRTAEPGLYEAADGSDWKVYVFPERMGLKPLCLSDNEDAYLPGNTFTKSYTLAQAHND